jgi:WD40 repeat protein
MIFYFE